MKAESCIPIIDFSLKDEDLVSPIKEACTTAGFFYLKNHGVPQDLIDRTLYESKKFYDLPMEEKLKTETDPGMTRGYNKFGAISLDPGNQKEGDQNERYTARTDLDPKNDIYKIRGKSKWPECLPSFKDTMVEYIDAMRHVGARVVQLYALALGVEKDFFAPFYVSDDSAVTPVRYSAARSRPEEGVYGCGAHSDWGMTTLLMTDGVQGLQILRENSKKEEGAGNWEDVPYIPCAYVVNIGDMLQRWSNDVFKSTKHRVVKYTDEPRYSLPFFYEPCLNANVEAIESCVPEGEEPKNPPIVYSDYLDYKMRTSYGGYTAPPTEK